MLFITRICLLLLRTHSFSSVKMCFTSTYTSYNTTPTARLHTYAPCYRAYTYNFWKFLYFRTLFTVATHLFTVATQLTLGSDFYPPPKPTSTCCLPAYTPFTSAVTLISPTSTFSFQSICTFVFLPRVWFFIYVFRLHSCPHNICQNSGFFSIVSAPYVSLMTQQYT